ncbi:hypothetical protein LOAG_03541 [Loa loa]|uniref:Uncharacterized protein n=1 Tax=Loa loa TaxID=7209 RepID=A0A1S0U4Z0_LOALO|nr:hypothetical protein LOAG_03541 [Loa loa]EFO24942.1 hypothetical protein LOAG_03541 [Loa loa]
MFPASESLSSYVATFFKRKERKAVFIVLKNSNPPIGYITYFQSGKCMLSPSSSLNGSIPYALKIDAFSPSFNQFLASASEETKLNQKQIYQINFVGIIGDVVVTVTFSINNWTGMN